MLANVEQADVSKIVERLDKCVDPWCALTNEDSGAWETSPGSALAVGDSATDPYRMSTTAWTSITAAVDHLRCFRDSFVDSRTPSNIETVIRINSQYTLLRAALENSSWAVWALTPDDPDERIVRRLRVEATSIDSIARLSRTIGVRLDPDKAARLRRLRTIAAGAGLTSSQVSACTRIVSHAEVVRDAATAIGANPVVGVAIWSMGSGVAHADFQSSLLFLSHTVQREAAPGIALSQFGGSVGNLHLGTLAATATINAAFNLYKNRASV